MRELASFSKDAQALRDAFDMGRPAVSAPSARRISNLVFWTGVAVIASVLGTISYFAGINNWL